MTSDERNPNTRDIDLLDTMEVLRILNREDRHVATAVEMALPQVAEALNRVVDRISRGARMFYVGCGSSGRIGVLDAVECQAVFGAGQDQIQAVLAGGYEACFEDVDTLEDDPQRGAADLRRRSFRSQDVVVGIDATGSSLYTMGAVRFAASRGALTLAAVCRKGSELSHLADLSIELDTGPESIQGAYNMKAASALKLVLNMMSTVVMIRLGRVYSNFVVGMPPNSRRSRRNALMAIREAASLSEEEADEALTESGDIPVSIVMGRLGCGREKAREVLAQCVSLRRALGEA